MPDAVNLPAVNVQIAAMPGEAALVAGLNFGTKVLEYAITYRQTMSEENKSRFDSVHIAHLERLNRFFDAVENLGKGAQS